MATVTEAAAKAVSEYAEPVLSAVDENVRNAQRAVVSRRHAVEDVAAETIVQVRRHPLVSLAIAAAVGTLFGCWIGFTAGRFGTGRTSE
jgi:ElaB/YqjD/DUF883 family membrane-anchored ribosome-binding protein